MDLIFCPVSCDGIVPERRQNEVKLIKSTEYNIISIYVIIFRVLLVPSRARWTSTEGGLFEEDYVSPAGVLSSTEQLLVFVFCLWFSVEITESFLSYCEQSGYVNVSSMGLRSRHSADPLTL